MKSGNQTKIFEDKQKFYIEIPNEIEFFLKSGWRLIQDNITNIKDQNQKIARLVEYLKSEPGSYNTIIGGLLYGMLYENLTEYSEYVFVLSKDNHDYLINLLIDFIIEMHTKFTSKNILTITMICDKLSVMTNPLLIDLFFCLIRIFYCGTWIMDNLESYRILIQFTKSKLSWILNNKQNHAINLIGVIFVKILRMVSENLCSINIISDNRINYKDILADEIYILNSLWENKKEEILLAGRELFRLIISISKSNLPQLKKILEDISKMFTAQNQPIYLNLLMTSNNIEGINFYSLVMIPPNFEKKMKFILFETNRNNVNWYINHIIRDFKLNYSECDKALFTDLIRYLVTNFDLNQRNYKTQRYVLIGYFLQNIKNEVINGEVKQALFIDWERDCIFLLEPAVMMICYSAKNFPEITMELIEFLDYYAKSFQDFLRKDIYTNISLAFRECEKRQIITSLDYVLKEEKINSDIKQIFKNLCDTKEENFMEKKYSETIPQKNLEKSSSLNMLINSPIHQNQIPQNIFDSENESEEDLKLNENLINSAEAKFQSHKKTDKKILEIEFFINPKLSDLIDTTILNNFINYKSKKTFISLLDNFLVNFLQKLKSKNLLESKLAIIDQEVNEIYLHFANFFIRTFKDELELEDINKFFNNDKISYEVFIENSRNNTKEFSAICNSIIDCYLIKFRNKNEKEISIVIEIINKIIDLYPKFVVRLFAFLIKRLYSMKIKRLQDLKLHNFNTIFSINTNPDKIYIDIVNKLFKDNIDYLKSRIRLLFEISISELNFEFLNTFILKGLIFVPNIIENDNEFITKILTYSSTETINGLCNFFNGIAPNNNFIALSFFSNAEKLIKMLDISIDLTLFEQEKLWILLNSTKNLNKILPFKDFINIFVKYLKNLFHKNQNTENNKFSNFINFKNMIFKNFSYSLRLFYSKEIENLNENPEKFVSDIVNLFEIPVIFSEEIYNFLKSFYFLLKKLPEILSNMIEEFIKKYDNDANKNFYFLNFLNLIKNFIFFEKLNMFPVLFDQNNYPLKYTIMRLNTLSKVNFFLNNI